MGDRREIIYGRQLRKADLCTSAILKIRTGRIDVGRRERMSWEAVDEVVDIDSASHGTFFPTSLQQFTPFFTPNCRRRRKWNVVSDHSSMLLLQLGVGR